MFDMCNVDLRPVITSSLGPGDSFQLLQRRSILATFSSFLELQTPQCVLISSLDIYLPSPPVRCVLSCFLSGSKQKFKWFEFFNKNQIAVLLSLHMLWETRERDLWCVSLYKTMLFRIDTAVAGLVLKSKDSNLSLILHLRYKHWKILGLFHYLFWNYF